MRRENGEEGKVEEEGDDRGGERVKTKENVRGGGAKDRRKEEQDEGGLRR